MEKMRHKIEILAPAGGHEQLLAAVACGADAVYLGGSAMNARRGAENFEGDALFEAVRYCRVRGVKVHLTLNTVVLEKELPAAREMARTARLLGVDAVIVQDLGMAALLREEAPELPLHASTQMAVHNLAGAKQLEALGFARVVLAREMSRAEIAAVVENTALETEIFVHGALCMCVSGQCYMSAIIGERSGNRGLCAQPCRLPFYLREKGACDLSLKDLSLVERMEELQALGVTSAKIEGRMKRPEYVAAAVTACKNALAGGVVDIERLQAVFSRSGFTQGYYDAHRGGEMFGTRGRDDVVSAEGVLKDLAQLYRREVPRVALCGVFALEPDRPARLTLTDSDGNTAKASGECPQAALNKPTTAEMIQQSIGKLGGTPYYLESLEITCGEGLMLPVSQMNGLRREAIDQLTAIRGGGYAPADNLGGADSACNDCAANGGGYAPVGKTGGVARIEAMSGQGTKNNPKEIFGLQAGDARCRFARAEQLPLAALDGIEQVILPVLEAVKVSDPAILGRLTAELPRIDFENYRHILPALEVLKQRGVTRLLAGNIGGVWLAKRQGFSVGGDWGLNVTNSRALGEYLALGCEDVTLSFEMNLNDVKRLGAGAPCGILAYGHLPLMVTRNCPARQEQSCGDCGGNAKMYDRLGNCFTVSCGGGQKTAEIFNCLPLYLADRLPELSGISFLTLYFTDETQQECARVLYEYRHGGKREKMTRGLYFRNVQ